MVFVVLIFCQLIELFASTYTETSPGFDVILYSIGWDISMIMTITFNVLIACALYRVTRIVNSTKQGRKDLNRCPIAFQVIGLFIWSFTYVGEGLLYVICY